MLLSLSSMLLLLLLLLSSWKDGVGTLHKSVISSNNSPSSIVIHLDFSAFSVV
jgi:hypothetical protein